MLRHVMIGEGILVIITVMAVMVEAHRFRTPSLHIWLVSLSYMTLVGAILNLAHSRNDQITAVLALTLGVGAMLVMLYSYRPSIRRWRHSQESERLAQRMADRQADHPLDS